MSALFQLSDRQWSAISGLLPTNQPGARRVDDRRVISGTVHVLRSGCRWQDTPAEYGPPTTIYNRFHRWSQRGIWQALFDSLVEVTPGGIQAIDITAAKAQRAASGGKGGAAAQAVGRSRGGPGTKIHAVADDQGRIIAFTITAGQLGDARAAHGLLAPLPRAQLCLADGAYDSGGLRQFLTQRDMQPVIPNNPTRKRVHPFDRTAYTARNLIERAFCRLKDWRRLATRYDKLATNFASAVAFAATTSGGPERVWTLEHDPSDHAKLVV